jgi:hypothetical protein
MDGAVTEEQAIAIESIAMLKHFLEVQTLFFHEIWTNLYGQTMLVTFFINRDNKISF